MSPFVSLEVLPAEYEIAVPFARTSTYDLHYCTYLPTNFKLIMKIFSEAVKDSAKTKLREEGWKLLRLQESPHIFKLHHCFIFGNRLHVVLDYTKRETLTTFLSTHKDNSLPLLKRFAKSLAHALHFMHKKGVEHNNLTSSNILICYANDFPVAKLTGQAPLLQELAEGVKELSKGCSDVYSYGEVLYKSLFGEKGGYLLSPPKFPEGLGKEYEGVVGLIKRCRVEGVKVQDIANDPFFQ
eukprot:TRINITY_DN4886_c0_g1_i1.p1 TRINITY_DN4886_c0_g1~~TRINITY_DN4886_c0_g1_i1.p1  ORF type:complete len:240 (-),score=41.77 TRINITY_DN4886_c0_g1_i1:115-834(-)